MRLPYVEGLKGRRAVTASLTAKLKRFNVSVLDLSGAYAKEADIALVFLSPSSKEALRYLQRIEKMLYRDFGEFESMIEFEMI